MPLRQIVTFDLDKDGELVASLWVQREVRQGVLDGHCVAWRRRILDDKAKAC